MRFHKLGGLHPGRFLKPYQAKVVSINRKAVSQVYMVTMVVDCSEEAVVKQFVLLYSVARKFSHACYWTENPDY